MYVALTKPTDLTTPLNQANASYLTSTHPTNKLRDLDKLIIYDKGTKNATKSNNLLTRVFRSFLPSATPKPKW